MRISKIAIVALGAALIGACQAKSPEAAKDTNVENAAEADVNASESIEPGTAGPTQASPSDSDVPAPKGQRRRR
jgi:hypothetical protein